MDKYKQMRERDREPHVDGGKEGKIGFHPGMNHWKIEKLYNRHNKYAECIYVIHLIYQLNKIENFLVSTK